MQIRTSLSKLDYRNPRMIQFSEMIPILGRGNFQGQSQARIYKSPACSSTHVFSLLLSLLPLH
jgi:hypothetical protein